MTVYERFEIISSDKKFMRSLVEWITNYAKVTPNSTLIRVFDVQHKYKAGDKVILEIPAYEMDNRVELADRNCVVPSTVQEAVFVRYRSEAERKEFRYEDDCVLFCEGVEKVYPVRWIRVED